MNMQTSCRKLMNYRYILPLNLSFIHSSIHPFIHSYIHPCIHSFIRVFILSFHSICKPGTYISLTQFLYPVIFVSLSIHPPIYIFIFIFNIHSFLLFPILKRIISATILFYTVTWGIHWSSGDFFVIL